MRPTLLCAGLAAASLARFQPAASAAEPLPAALGRAATEMPAGGVVWAESRGGQISYGTAGRVGAPSGVAPERVLFEVGSITKVFTGLLLAQATLDGKVALEDPIAKHLPANVALDPRVAAITLAQLSSHTSGLPRLPDNLQPSNAADPYADYSEERLLDFLRRYRPEKPAPQPADYSNLGAGLLGHLLARAYGVSYEELLRMKITGPLGLSDTVVTLSAEQQTRFAAPHSGTMAVPPWRLAVLAGAGGIRSTAADLMKFAHALLDERSPLAAAWKVAREPRAPMGPRGHVGLGIFQRTDAGRVTYNHGGGTGGFRSYLEIEPATHAATVVLLNNDTPDPAALVAAAQRPAATPSAPAKSAPVVSLSAAELTAFTGVYAIDARGRFTVVLDAEGHLRARLTGQAFLRIDPLGADRFAARGVAAEFQFQRDAAGKVSAIVLHQNGREVPAQRTGDAPVIHFPPAEQLRAYEGIYELAPGAVFEVKVGARSATLTVKLTGQPAFPVHNTAPDHFVYDVVEAALTFEREASGQVTAVVLHQNGRDQRAPRQAKK